MIAIYHRRFSQMEMVFFKSVPGFLIDQRRAAGAIAGGVLMHHLAGGSLLSSVFERPLAILTTR